MDYHDVSFLFHFNVFSPRSATPILGVKLYWLLWSICYEYCILILSCVRWHVHKVSHHPITLICDLLHCSDQLCKSLFHWGWWIYCLIRPYNAIHREIGLLHGHDHWTPWSHHHLWDVHFCHHHWIPYHPKYVVSLQTCDPTFHDVIHIMFQNNEWYPLLE